MTATNDAYTAHNDATFGVPPARGLLANDSDTQHRAVTLDQLDGNGGPLPLHGTSARGAAVVVHADGGFSYDARRGGDPGAAARADDERHVLIPHRPMVSGRRTARRSR